jgi:chromosome segregation ATPase
MIADERVLQMRQEMTMSIKELTLQCSVYLEKIQRKDGEYRKLMMQLAELKEWRVKYDEVKRRHSAEIEKLMREIERLKVELVEH